MIACGCALSFISVVFMGLTNTIATPGTWTCHVSGEWCEYWYFSFHSNNKNHNNSKNSNYNNSNKVPMKTAKTDWFPVSSATQICPRRWRRRGPSWTENHIYSSALPFFDLHRPKYGRWWLVFRQPLEACSPKPGECMSSSPTKRCRKRYISVTKTLIL